MGPVPSHADVLVLGAGYVGSVAARLLGESGHSVVAVRRTPPEQDDDAVHWLSANLADPADRARLPATADLVICTLSPGGGGVPGYRQAHLDIPRLVVQGLLEPPSRVILTTSTAVYDVADGSWVDEGSPTAPGGQTAQVLVEAEAAMASLASTTVALRLGGIYGPGRTRLLEQVRAGEATCAPGQWTNRIHRDDAAAAIAHVLGLTQPPTVVNVVDDAPTERCEVLSWLAQQMGAPAPTVLPPGQAERSRGGSKRVSNAVLRATGWVPTHATYREGYLALLQQ